MICKICGAVIDDSDKCCLGCGSVLDDDLKDEMVICPNCHCANSVDDEHCVECGSYLFEDTYSDCSNSINYFDIQPEIAKENDNIQTEEPNMYCKECNAYVNMKNGCCAECGAPLNANSSKRVQAAPSKSAPAPVPSKAKIYCRECGTENETGARFCCECGAQMNSNTPAPVQKQVQEEPKQISNEIVGKSYYFKRKRWSYYYERTIVEFEKNSLHVKYESIPYSNIRSVGEYEKINIGQLSWVIMCAIGALCAFAVESVLTAIVLIILGAIDVTKIKDSHIYITEKNGRTHIVRMSKNDSDKYDFISDLNSIIGE